LSTSLSHFYFPISSGNLCSNLIIGLWGRNIDTVHDVRDSESLVERKLRKRKGVKKTSKATEILLFPFAINYKTPSRLRKEEGRNLDSGPCDIISTSSQLS